MKQVITFLGLVLISLSLGCATPMGPSYSPVTNVAAGKAVVYVYKAKSYGGGLYKLTGNGEAITQLQKGGYFPYVTDPGSVELAAYKRIRIGELIPDPTHRLTINVSAGETRYVKITSGLIVKLVEVSADKAQKELKKCELLPPWDEG